MHQRIVKRSTPAIWRPGRQPGPRDEVIFDKVFAEEYGLVGAWILNAMEPRDLSGVGNHGTSIGTTQGLVSAPVGIAVDFQGDNNNDRIDLGSIASNNPLSLSGSNTCTIVARTDYGSGNNNSGRLIDKSISGNASGGWTFYANNSNSRTIFQFGPGTSNTMQSNTSLLGGWQTWAVRRNGSSGNVYLDGADVTATNTMGTGNFQTTTANAALGNWNHATDRNWNGPIEYCYIFDEFLDVPDIYRIQRMPYRHIVPVPKKALIFLPIGEPPPPPGGIKFGALNVVDVKKGSAAVSKVYKGSTQVWPTS